MENKIQQLEQQVAALKIRAFDAEEALKAEREGINTVMQQVVNIAKVKGDENGAVTVDAILERITKLVDLEKSTDNQTVEVEGITE